MLALLATLAFVAAATFAITVVFVTMKGRHKQIVKLLADYRSLQHDRAFLVYLTSFEQPALRRNADLQMRRAPRRALNRPEVAINAQALRVAA